MPPRGGKRSGAGRPKGEPSKVIRVPESLLPRLQGLMKMDYRLPVYMSKVQAGFPSPADDVVDFYLDLNAKLIKHPAATFVVQAIGDSMVDAGILPGSWLLVDRSLTPCDGHIVIAALDGELTVKRLSKAADKALLLPANPKYPAIPLTEQSTIWGVVTSVIQELV